MEMKGTASWLCYLSSCEYFHIAHCIGGCAVTTADLDSVEKINNTLPCRETNDVPSHPKPDLFAIFNTFILDSQFRPVYAKNLSMYR